MTKKEEYTRTVRYNQQTADKFDKIGLKLGRDNRLVFAQMVDYFYKSKKDPVDLNDELLKNTILKQQKEYIGFIKTQETELLIPVKRDLGRLMDFEQKVYNLTLKPLPKQIETLTSGVAFQNQQLKDLAIDTQRRLSAINNSLLEKEQLKRQFLTILDKYAKARENFGVMSPKQEKEMLLQSTRSLIQNL
ncbi:MAG: BfmA/BtgA family mobilization protein [Bacteroidota bacterium]